MHRVKEVHLLKNLGVTVIRRFLHLVRANNRFSPLTFLKKKIDFNSAISFSLIVVFGKLKRTFDESVIFFKKFEQLSWL